MDSRLAPSERHAYKTAAGQTVYEWDQSFQEVNIYICVPPGTRSKQLFVEISTTHLRFGLHNNPPYLDKDLAGGVKVSDSLWTLEDGTLHIVLHKLQQGEPWPCAIKGHELDPAVQQQETQRLMLERFQAEHPGFDFSGAQFSGEAPNPRTFMSGMDTK